MKNWKRYEMYTDKIRTGILNVNESVYKKAVSLSVAGIIAVTTLSGCTRYESQMNAPLSKLEQIEFADNEEEITIKHSFIELVLKDLQYAIDEYNNTLAVGQKNQIWPLYIEMRDAQYLLEPTCVESVYYTKEELNKRILNAANKCIRLIEEKTIYRFEDYLKNIEKQQSQETFVENIDNKKYFIDSVLCELEDAILKDGNTIAMGIKNRVKDSYYEITKLEETINPNYEYYSFYTEEEINNKKRELNELLNEIINIFEETTNYRYGIDFIPKENTK